MGLRARLIGMMLGVMIFAFVLLLAGVNFGLRNDVQGLAQQSADAGASALSFSLSARSDAARNAVLQATTQAGLASAIGSRDASALRNAMNALALVGDLSFAVVTDAKGNVLAGSRPGSGSLANDGMVKAALGGESQSGAEIVDPKTLAAVSMSIPPPAAGIAVAAPVRAGGRTIGVLYGVSLFNAESRFVDEVARVTGGAAGFVVNGHFVATSITGETGEKQVGLAIPLDAKVVSSNATATGLQSVAGTQYFTKATPLAGWDGKSIGALWFGVPYAQFAAIVNNTLRQIIVWSIVGLVIASIVGTIVASRIGRAISRRSEEVNASAKQLKVLVVGGEVSGDHVTQTRETLEEIKQLAQEAEATARLHALAGQALDDVVVIDTLTSELSTRMRDAAVSVERLSAVAEELDALVAGARPSKN